MKKNRMMRAASALLVAVLMTTCTISGTFAKYVTEASATDTARVAKWGVEVTATGESFAKAYDADKTDKTVQVEAGSEDKLVAPGTKNADAVSLAITGTPEVATKVDVKVEGFKDVYLKEGTYTDYTKKDADGNYGTFTIGAEGYYPVKWTLVYTKGGVVTKYENKSLTAIKEFIEANVDDWKYAPGEKLDATFDLSWAWAIDGNDKADTFLGNIAADMTPATATGEYSTSISYNVTISATQVD